MISLGRKWKVERDDRNFAGPEEETLEQLAFSFCPFMFWSPNPP